MKNQERRYSINWVPLLVSGNHRLPLVQMSNYNFSLTTFSSTGKLTQIEYALNAVGQGVTSIGLKGKLLRVLEELV